jgi:catechol 2,3-dioxygenase
VTTTPQPTAPPRPMIAPGDRLGYAAVHLDVTDLERSLGFWRDLIGLQPVATSGDGTGLGVDGHPLIVLHEGAVRGAARGAAGLYHVAIHVPDDAAFATVLARLIIARMPQSPTDHVFSKATYLHDPDGIMLEVTLETPERFRSIEISPAGVVMYDANGQPRQATGALDVEAALAPLGDRDPMVALPPGTFVGHVHLHVPDLNAATAFYRDVVGFTEHAVMTPYGMADLSAGGRFPHRIAINGWHGPQARQAAPGTAGMRQFELAVAGAPELAALTGRVVAAGVAHTADPHGLRFTDPAGNLVIVRAPVLASAV